MLNRVVEPIVRRGVGSPRLAPSGFIVLETVGRKSGELRRSPLAATRIGRHMIVATFRGGPLAVGAQPRRATAHALLDARAARTTRRPW
jgi:hypothetical protein